jgi:hypothetical protein
MPSVIIIWSIMKVERETINAACSLAPKRISPERQYVACQCALWFVQISNIWTHGWKCAKFWTWREFTSQQGREDTGAESEERGDVSQDLPMEVDADLSMQTEQKNINEAFVHLVYNFKLAEMNKYLLWYRKFRAVLPNLFAIVYLVGVFMQSTLHFCLNSFITRDFLLTTFPLSSSKINLVLNIAWASLGECQCLLLTLGMMSCACTKKWKKWANFEDRYLNKNNKSLKTVT